MLGVHPIPPGGADPYVAGMAGTAPAADVEGATGPSAGGWMVECFWPGVSESAVAEATNRIDAASAELTGSGLVARRTVATYVPAEETVIWLFEADGEESLRTLARQAGVRFDRVLPVVTSSAVAGTAYRPADA
jgi:hypothetical protein